MKIDQSIFKAYDIRGIYPEQISEEVVEATARAYSKWLMPKKVVLGRDGRLSSSQLSKAAEKGLVESGIDVLNIGEVTTDIFYFTVGEYRYDGGIMISGSHNPSEWNGLKMVKKGVEAISSDSGLFEIRDLAEKGGFENSEQKGKVKSKNVMQDYIDHILSFIDVKKIKPQKIVVNTNFGVAKNTLLELEKRLPIDLIKLNFEINGNFPKGRPDPYRPETRGETEKLVKKENADFGTAWDADADRCFFFDENGNWIEPCYLSAALIEKMLKKSPGEKVIYDPRVTWPVIRAAKENGGTPLLNKVGHTFFKERMRKENALFTSESSAHYYFRDNFYADNGMIPFLMILEEVSITGKKLSELVSKWQKDHSTTGEINYEVKNPQEKIKEIEKKYTDGEIDKTDGISIEYKDWRFNLRPSNTEPLLRLNIEAKSKELMGEKLKEIESQIIS